MEKAKCMLEHANMPMKLWAEAVLTATYLINRSPTSALKDKVPIEAWTGNKPNIKHLRTFGALATVHIPKEKRRKLDNKSKICLLVGYEKNFYVLKTICSGYRLDG
jgi:hypothetical protein